MDGVKGDGIAAGVIGFTHALFPFLVLVNILHWDAKQMGAGQLVVSTGVTLAGLIFARRRRTIATVDVASSSDAG